MDRLVLCKWRLYMEKHNCQVKFSSDLVAFENFLVSSDMSLEENANESEDSGAVSWYGIFATRRTSGYC